VDVEFSSLHVRLQPQQPGIETPYLPVMFALTDALVYKECDMLLPAHTAHELHACSEVHVVTEDSPCNCNGGHGVNAVSGNTLECDATGSFDDFQINHAPSLADDDSGTIVSDDDLDQDREVDTRLDNADFPPVEITNPSDWELLMTEQQGDHMLAPYWGMAKQNKGRM